MNGVQEKWMIGIMVSVTIVKFCLMVYCRRFKNEIVRAYAQDHFFDVVTNSVGLVAAVLAVRFAWWIDPTGAIVVSSFSNKNFPFSLASCLELGNSFKKQKEEDKGHKTFKCLCGNTNF